MNEVGHVSRFRKILSGPRVTDMTDIFLSYAREDMTRASHLATTLVGYGWSVFWDRRIPIGKSFDQVIEKELDAARCVIVLWSPHAVASDWVRAEAREGARRKILHPVWVKDVTVPLEFRALQTAHLVDWRPGEKHPEFDQLLTDITTTLGPPPIASAGTTERGHAPAGEKQPITPKAKHLVFGSITVVLVLAIAIGVMTFIRQPATPRPTTLAPAPSSQSDAQKASALFDKGEQYYYGRGVGKDYAKAAEMYRLAADQGHAQAQASLGWMYAEGQGVPKDDAEALKWYRKAADQGDVWAQHDLGDMYDNGRGVPKDDAEAVKWYRKAAQQGSESARGELRKRQLGW